jgi:hypothetical protein
MMTSSRCSRLEEIGKDELSFGIFEVCNALADERDRGELD